MIKGIVVGTCVLLLFAAHASGQSVANATIRGRVTDATSGASPGVTVAATSPSLIAPQIVVVTDTGGEYTLPDLPIGIYRVS